MSQRQVLMVFGVWLAVLPFLGFPLDWEKTLACLSGLLIVFLAYRLRPVNVAKNDPAAMPYAEHKAVSTANEDQANPISVEVPAKKAVADQASITDSANSSTK